MAKLILDDPSSLVSQAAAKTPDELRAAIPAVLSVS